MLPVWVRNGLLIALVLATAGCGYHVSGLGSTPPGGASRICVDTFRNRTAEPFLDVGVTNAVIRRLQRGRVFQVVGCDQAEAVLTGAVTRYQSSPVSYDSQDNVSEYRAQMTLTVRLEAVDSGRHLWQGRLERKEEFTTSGNLALQEDRERETQGVLAEYLADDLYERLTDNF